MGGYFNLDLVVLQELLRCSPLLTDMRTDRAVERGLIPDALLQKLQVFCVITRFDGR